MARRRVRHTGGVSPDPLDLAAQRVSYTAGELHERDLHAHPLGQFRAWYEAATAVGAAGGLPEPNAMTLATAGADGVPSARTVLLKGADGRGFVFFTNLASRKGAQIAGNPRVALCFPWIALHRQVGVVGVAEALPREQTEAYFRSRPWASRIGAWASHQSRPVAGRVELDAAWDECAGRWPDRGSPDDVPVPEHWGGLLVRATEVEFWQGRVGRLHDRLVYRAVGPGGAPVAASDRSPRAPLSQVALDDASAWRVERLQP